MFGLNQIFIYGKHHLAAERHVGAFSVYGKVDEHIAVLFDGAEKMVLAGGGYHNVVDVVVHFQLLHGFDFGAHHFAAARRHHFQIECGVVAA